MSKTQLPSNFHKHTSQNPLQKFLIGNFYKTLIGLLSPLSVKTVLDVGCGEGFSLNKLSEHAIGNKLEGVDYSPKAITLGKKLFPKLSLQQGSIYDLPYKDSAFDLVLCTEVLEHLDDPKKGLQEALRVSRRYVLCSVPNEPFFMLSNFLRGKNVMQLGNDPGHINHWTFVSFPKFIHLSGGKIRIIKFPFPWIMMLIEK